MVDLVITAANVIPGANAVVEKGTAGATVSAGQAVYKDPTTGKFKLAECDSVTAAVRQPYGLALNGASDGQPLAVIRQGALTIGAAIAAGVAYYLTATPGGICPVADLLTGNYPALLGMGKSTTMLAVDIQSPGVAL